MPLMTFFATVRTHVVDAVQTLAVWPRASWCRKQRRILGAPGAAVVWVRGETLSWATWGARRGYFDVQFMNGLAYLRAAGAPTS